MAEEIMADLAFMLTDEELLQVKERYGNLCKYAAWEFTTSRNCPQYAGSVKRLLLNAACKATLKFRQSEGTLNFDSGRFNTFCKQVIWNAQEALRGKVPGLGGTGEEHRG